MTPVSDNEYRYSDKYYFKFYEKKEVVNLIDNTGFSNPEISEVTWDEPPHEGYREYPHSHTSFEIIATNKK